MMDKKEEKSPLKIFYKLVIKGDSILYLGYNDESDEYSVYLDGFPNMQVNLKLLQLSKLLYQLGAEFINEDGSSEPCFVNHPVLMADLVENNNSCEVVDIKNDNILIYRRSDNMENFPADGVFFIGPFIPDHLLNSVDKPRNLLKPDGEEAFVRGYKAALSELDSFIYEQREKFNKPGELAEVMASVKGAMVN